MTYKFDGHAVSKPWHIVLKHLRKAGFNFHINDGRRSLALQRRRVQEHGLYNAKTNPTGAARPSLAAPHINFGRANHALDADNAAGLCEALNARGVRCTRPMAAEPWHLQVDRGDLIRYANRILKAAK